MLQLSEETKNESIAALEELNNQRESLTNVNKKVSNIDRLLIKSNKVIDTIRSISSNIINKIFGSVDTNVPNQNQNIVFERVRKEPCQSPLYDPDDNVRHPILKNKQYTNELDIILNNISDIKKIIIYIYPERFIKSFGKNIFHITFTIIIIVS